MKEFDNQLFLVHIWQCFSSSTDAMLLKDGVHWGVYRNKFFRIDLNNVGMNRDVELKISPAGYCYSNGIRAG